MTRQTIQVLVSVLVVLLLTAIATPADAAPEEIHAQGVLRDSDGDLAAGDQELVFAIYDSEAGEQALWQETVTVTLIGGVFDTLLPADPIASPLPADLFLEDDRWLGITPSGQDELARTRLSSVPYALQADVAGDLQCSGCIAADEVDFNYASSDAPGGAATTSLFANEALVANNVSCVGCVTLDAMDAAVLSADNISYNNVLSGLASVTVQDAIDENALGLADHVADSGAHGSGGGDGGAKVRVVANDVMVVSGQVATEYLYVFSADTPKVYLYAHGRASTEGEGAAPGGGGGTVFYTRCAWVGAHAEATGSCTPPACPEGWTDLGFIGNVKTGSSGTGYNYYTNDADNAAYTASSGYQERSCYHPMASAVAQPRCAWTGAHAESIGSCTPPTCPDGWTDWGVTGNVRTGSSGTGYDYYTNDADNAAYTASSGYQERTCVNQVKSEIPQGVQLWVDGVDQTAAIGDQQGKGAPSFTGATWGADGTTPWSTGRLDISQVSDWGVGEHSLQFKNTGESGGKIQYHVFFVDPAAASVAFPNDGCGGAEALVFEGGVATVNGTTEDMLGENKALDDLSPAGCGGDGGLDVVYSATITERTTITAQVAAPFATRLYILDSPCQAETVLACGTDEVTTLELDPGTYYVVVDADAPGQTGDFSLTVELEASPLPVNDTCATPTAIAAGPVLIQVNGTTRWGLDQYAGSCSGDGAADVVYSFVADNANDDLVVTIDAPFAAVLILRAQTCEGGFQMACSTTGSLSSQGMAPGTYYLFVDGVTPADEGAFTLDVILD